MYGNFTVKKINRVTGGLELFKKYKANFVPFLIDIKVDCCEFARNVNYRSPADPLLNVLARVIETVYPSILSGCPYEV